MLRASYLTILIGILLSSTGCPNPGTQDDDDTSADDDAAGDDDASDDDTTADDDDTADDDTTADDDDTAVDCADAEPCEGDYGIENESDLEAIALCESISGDLDFSSQSWLTSLDLPCLTSVGGGLLIQQNDNLTVSPRQTPGIPVDPNRG